MTLRRRDFFASASLGALGGVAGWGNRDFFKSTSPSLRNQKTRSNSIAKNIIFLVSDGMSSGTLQMADLMIQKKFQRHSHWIQAYLDGKISRGLMDTASLNSYVTDSAAASSAWGCGHRVRNGRLNVGPGDQNYKPIWQKFKGAGKGVGCVTSVPITHATPAGFCVNNKSRNGQPEIAENYLDLRFDVMLGGGREFFAPESRSDQQDLFASFTRNGFHVAQSRTELKSIPVDQAPVLGVFSESAIPYAVDHQNDSDLLNQIPTLAEMSAFALNRLRRNPDGFVIQIEGGQVDWAAHANDTPGLLFDQLAFDDVVGMALEFAEEDGETLVIITTDHGNANPGLIGTSNSIERFDRVLNFRHSHQWFFRQLNADSSRDDITGRLFDALSIEISPGEAEQLQQLLSRIPAAEFADPYKLPFEPLGRILKNHTAIGWSGTDHSADFVELAMFGPGSENLPAFILNNDLHNFMLQATGCLNELVEVG
jgi:alkaline phosphatase